MRALSTVEWLSLWESGLRQHPARWVLALLAEANPDISVERLAQISLGQRDADVLALRRSLFGSTIASVTTCPACGEELELAFDADAVRAAASPAPGEAGQLVIDEWEIDFRLPNSSDLLAIANAPEIEAGVAGLRQRCILAIRREGQAVPADQWPETLIEAVTEHMAQLDPMADMQLAIDCSACAQRWHADFDIVRFLWNELHTWAIHTLRDVHRLAAAYGWSEADILALSTWRRQVYLELIS